ncbi:MAG: hypothetical protein ACK44W_12115, partial [Planctomycetota bacterium]
DRAPERAPKQSAPPTPASATAGNSLVLNPRAAALRDRILSGNRLVTPENPTEEDLKAMEYAQELQKKGAPAEWAAAQAARRVDFERHEQERRRRVEEKNRQARERAEKARELHQKRREEFEANRPLRPPPSQELPSMKNLDLGPPLLESSASPPSEKKP